MVSDNQSDRHVHIYVQMLACLSLWAVHVIESNPTHLIVQQRLESLLPQAAQKEPALRPLVEVCMIQSSLYDHWMR